MRRRIGRLTRRLLAVTMVMALCIPTVSVPVAYAADTPFSGGPVVGSAPTIVPNDHTPLAVRFTGTGLDPDSTYYAKVRLTLNPDPATGGGGSAHRGFIWNKTTGEWVRNRGEDWVKYPTVQTDGTGTIVSSNDANWLFFKFGNENNSGTYYLNITLNKSGVDGESKNSDTPLQVQVIDMKTEGAWLHNGTATGSTDFKRVTLNAGDAASSTDKVLTIHRTELNIIDDDSNGSVDDMDEDLGPTGLTGDWRLAALAESTVDAYIQQGLQFGGDFQMKYADEDIALGAADTTAPVAPANLSATADSTQINLTWDESSDDSGDVGYRVYRWVNVSSVEYTPAHELVTTTLDTMYEDTDVTPGVTYNYEVRAFDAATNVSARSASDSAMVVPPTPTVTAQADPAAPNGADGWYIGTAPKITLTAADGDAYYSWAEAGPFSLYTEPITAIEGQNTLYYYAEGDYSNKSDTYELPLKVDSVKPTTSVFVPPLVTRVSYHQSYDVEWSGLDGAASSGGLTYDVYYKVNADGDWKPWREGVSNTSDLSTGKVGRTYYWKVRARDAAGNVGDFCAEDTTMIPYDNVSMDFDGSWSTKTDPDYYLGSLRRTSSSASVTMEFEGGEAVYLITSTNNNRGKVKLYINGDYKKTISLYSDDLVQRKDIKLSNLSGKDYTVKLVAVPESDKPYVPIDGIAVKR